jgi:hypothetical protein
MAKKWPVVPVSAMVVVEDGGGGRLEEESRACL